jgi:hypothetical protein
MLLVIKEKKQKREEKNNGCIYSSNYYSCISGNYDRNF